MSHRDSTVIFVHFASVLWVFSRAWCRLLLLFHERVQVPELRLQALDLRLHAHHLREVFFLGVLLGLNPEPAKVQAKMCLKHEPEPRHEDTGTE